MFYKGQYIHAFFQKGLQGSVRMPMGDCSFSLAITLTCRHTCKVCLKPVGTTSFLNRSGRRATQQDLQQVQITKQELTW